MSHKGAPRTKVTIVGKTKFTVGKIWLGHFSFTIFWVPDRPPPPPSSTKWPKNGENRMTRAYDMKHM